MPQPASTFLRVLFSPIALMPGASFRAFQEKRFPAQLRDAERRGDGSVIVTDSVLKFHVNDRREQIYERWLARVAQFV